MGFGDFFTQAYNTATSTAKSAASAIGSGAQAVGSAAKSAGTYVANQAVTAGNYVAQQATAAKNYAVQQATAAKDYAVQQATAAKDYAVEKGTEAAHYVGEKAQQGYDLAKQGAQNVATGVGNVGSFAGRAGSETVSAAYNGVNKAFSGTQSPQQTAVAPCPNTLEGKKARLEERQRLINSGNASGDPTQEAAAKRLADNNQAVELARLSGDTYKQYGDPPVNNPPLGWTKMTDSQLQEKGIDTDLMKNSQAAIYQTPTDWPGGQKTVLAFRGTADREDGIVDYNQALGIETKQYKAAAELGSDVSNNLGSNVLVTGHSLGGGKAQAAGLAGGLKGEMFNAAGVHPDSVGGLTAAPGQFQQYRTSGDPLTGTQNSAAIQSVALGAAGLIGTPLGLLAKGGDAVAHGLGYAGLSPDNAQYADMATKAAPRALKNLWNSGNAMPPAQGTVHTVTSLDDAGNAVPGYNLLGQHSITNAVNGIEQQKTQDVTTLGGTN